MGEGMSDVHNLPPGVEVTVRLHLTSDAAGIDAVPSATYRGGMPSIADLSEDWRETVARLRMDVSPLDEIASDWRVMTRDEMEAYREENPE